MDFLNGFDCWLMGAAVIDIQKKLLSDLSYVPPDKLFYSLLFSQTHRTQFTLSSKKLFVILSLCPTQTLFSALEIRYSFVKRSGLFGVFKYCSLNAEKFCPSKFTNTNNMCPLGALADVLLNLQNSVKTNFPCGLHFTTKYISVIFYLVHNIQFARKAHEKLFRRTSNASLQMTWCVSVHVILTDS